ncbi:hypothetical protein GLP21_17635 [Photobacterium carnosum]|uniref:ParE-like toxin domain-containing protein n=1 Tax=Photobacterium carnosum TaxID=2023717 RepID=A0A2N4UWC9_9GAMM|nr:MULTISPECIES: hypothetical protein [Photobacterium]MCD9476301.1 hypothetical protein [Photobacterium phosphoreum]MCD9488101.1 hypothetical protein [Photobacterium iliopiscarium]MCD9508077.1 hypothetical protein [Photobacterium phosphoreum]MCD9539184.1 hypothetical protein [Photobacterium carnosum]MCD9542348.1 hypothetical protein [Photobacterium carnosum]
MGRQIKIDQCNFERAFKKSLKSITQPISLRAQAIADDIRFNKVNPNKYDGKRLNINRNIITVKVGNRHRLLMTETNNEIIPWQCLTHKNYNKMYMRISHI